MGNGEGTRPKGQFSRRHQTNREHEEAVAIYNGSSGLKSRRVNALARLIERKAEVEEKIRNEAHHAGSRNNEMQEVIKGYIENWKKNIRRIDKEIEVLQLRIQ